MIASRQCAYAHAYSTIRRNIVYCKYPPGEKLRIGSLASALNMSATPVREALSRLANESFIECREQRGFYTKPITRDDMQELLGLLQLHTGYFFRQIAAEGKLRPLAGAIRTTFDGNSAVEAIRGIETLRRTMADLVTRPNADQHYRLLFLRTQLLRTMEFNDPKRLAYLTDLARQAAGRAEGGHEEAFMERVDAFYQARFDWLDDVVDAANATISELHDAALPAEVT